MFTRFRGRGVLFAALAAVILPVALACGGDDDDNGSDSGSSRSRERDRSSGSARTVEVERWTEGLCGSALSFVRDVEDLGNDFNISDNATADEVKKALISFLSDVKERSDQFEDDIKDLGVPDTDDGKEIQQAMVDAAGTVVKTFDRALKDARALDTKNEDDLLEEITRIGASLSAASGPIERAFADIGDDFDTTDISEAAEDIPECGDLGGL